VRAIFKHCGVRYNARSAAGTGHLRRHMFSCMKNISMLVWYSLNLL
jgi:hypothetical protein